TRKYPLIGWGMHQRATVVAMFARQYVGITYANDPSRRVMSECESRQSDRRANRLQAARWYCDYEPPGVAIDHICERIRHGLQVPVQLQAFAAKYDRKSPLNEAIKIGSDHRFK